MINQVNRFGKTKQRRLKADDLLQPENGAGKGPAPLEFFETFASDGETGEQVKDRYLSKAASN